MVRDSLKNIHGNLLSHLHASRRLTKSAVIGHDRTPFYRFLILRRITSICAGPALIARKFPTSPIRFWNKRGETVKSRPHPWYA
jgi:hypothetical protein